MPHRRRKYIVPLGLAGDHDADRAFSLLSSSAVWVRKTNPAERATGNKRIVPGNG